MVPTSQCVGECTEIDQIAPAAIRARPFHSGVCQTKAAPTANAPTTVPTTSRALPSQTGSPQAHPGPERGRVDAADLVGVLVDEEAIELDALHHRPEPEGLQIGVPGRHGGLDAVEIGADLARTLRRRSCPNLHDPAPFRLYDSPGAPAESASPTYAGGHHV